MEEKILKAIESKIENLTRDEEQCKEVLQNNKVVMGKTLEKNEMENDLSKIQSEKNEAQNEIKYVQELFQTKEENEKILSQKDKLLEEKANYEKILANLSRKYSITEGKIEKTQEQKECENDLSKINDELEKMNEIDKELNKTNDEIKIFMEKYKIKEEPKKEEPKKEEPKKEEPKKEEPKKEEPKKEEPKKEEPKKEEPKKEEPKKEEPKKEEPKKEEPKVKVMIAVSKNKIDIQGKEDELFYKEEMKHVKELKKKYRIIFGKKIDWALVSTLENIDSTGTLTMDYLSVIKGESLNGKDLATSLEELNKKVDIEYVFDDEENGLVNRKPKAFARKANELGIASLVGINEKSLFDRMKDSIADRFKNRKLFQKKDKVKQLGKSSAEKQKEQVINLINKDREKYKNEQYNEMTNGDYMKSLDKSFEKAKEERMGQYKVNNDDNHFEENATNKIMEEQQEMTAKEVETLKADSVIDTNGDEIYL